MANILIIDDDRGVLNALVLRLSKMQHTALVAETLADGLEMLTVAPVDIVFLDVNLPDGNGLEALPAIRRSPSEPDVVIITGEGSAAGAEMAIRTGAWDYIQKPLAKKETELLLARALEYRASKQTRQPERVLLQRDTVIGSSPELNACLDLVTQCAGSDANVLITGETGTGKELFASVIHANGPAPDSPFVVVDCAALPEQLVESMLFGHNKGAFTSADSDRQGLVKEADGGTLFLDEIGELPLAVQKKFLRVLQERRFKPVGSRMEVRSDFRLVCATNRNLEKMAAGGRFRQDLLFRLRTFCIDLPPLRSCKADLRQLVMHYTDHFCQHYGLENKGFVPDVMEILAAQDWPGNVRELIHTLEKAVLSARDDPMIYPAHLPQHIRLASIQLRVSRKQDHHTEKTIQDEWADPDKLAIPIGALNPLPKLKPLRDRITEQLEHIYFQHLMAQVNNDLNKAVDISGLSKPRIYALLKKYNIARN